MQRGTNGVEGNGVERGQVPSPADRRIEVDRRGRLAKKPYTPRAFTGLPEVLILGFARIPGNLCQKCVAWRHYLNPKTAPAKASAEKISLGGVAGSPRRMGTPARVKRVGRGESPFPSHDPTCYWLLGDSFDSSAIDALQEP